MEIVYRGRGMGRLLIRFARFLRARGQVEVAHSWLFGSWAGFQFVMHILLWWQLWTVQQIPVLTFLTYLYLLLGPILLFLCTSLILPDLPEGRIDLAKHYDNVRKPYFTVGLLFWLWSAFIGLLLEGAFRPAAPLLAVFVGIMAVLRVTSNRTVHLALATVSWLLLAVFIVSYAVSFG